MDHNIERMKLVKIGCIESGISFADIGRMLGVSRNAVWRVVAGMSRSRKIEQKLVQLFSRIIADHPFGPVPRVPKSGPQCNCSQVQEGEGADPPTETRRRWQVKR